MLMACHAAFEEAISERSAMLAVGDHLVGVGGADAAKLSFDQVMKLLADAPSPVQLTLTRQGTSTVPVEVPTEGRKDAPAETRAMPATASVVEPAADTKGGALGGFAASLFEQAKSAAAEQALKAADAAKEAAGQAMADLTDNLKDNQKKR